MTRLRSKRGRDNDMCEIDETHSWSEYQLYCCITMIKVFVAITLLQFRTLGFGNYIRFIKVIRFCFEIYLIIIYYYHSLVRVNNHHTNFMNITHNTYNKFVSRETTPIQYPAEHPPFLTSETAVKRSVSKSTATTWHVPK